MSGLYPPNQSGACMEAQAKLFARACWQYQPGLQATPGAVFKIEFSAMQSRGARDDRQPQARSGRIAARVFQAHEWPLRRFALLGGNACAAICHDKNNPVSLLPELHSNFAALVFDR